jgi:hypothetical protein
MQPVSTPVKGGLLGPVLDKCEIFCGTRFGKFLFGFVQTINIGKVMFAVMKLHGLRINKRLECIVRVRQRRQLMLARRWCR